MNVRPPAQKIDREMISTEEAAKVPVNGGKLLTAIVAT